MADRSRQILGDRGETIAVNFLRQRGFSNIRKNAVTPLGEIDIIAEKDDCTVFFEVKTRRSERFGPPLDAITRSKREHILKNCRCYIKRYGLADKPCRIDAIGIELDDNGNVRILKHIVNAIEGT